MSTKVYTVNEVFYSPQGEGGRAGEMSVFVRFTGCNMACRLEPGPRSPGGFDCDTEFASGTRHTLVELLGGIRDAVPPEVLGRCMECHPWVVYTGGEPGLQLDPELTEAVRGMGFRQAVETNGSLNLDHLRLDWVTVSPKVAEHAVRQLTANEVRYVRASGQGIPQPACKAPLQYISPAFDGTGLRGANLAWCLSLIRDHPEWRISMQQHKLWRVR